METRGRSGGGAAGRAHSPAASHPASLGAGPKKSGRERRAERAWGGGAGARCRGHQCGGGSTLRGLSATESPHPHPGNAIRGRHPGWTDRGE